MEISSGGRRAFDEEIIKGRHDVAILGGESKLYFESGEKIRLSFARFKYHRGEMRRQGVVQYRGSEMSYQGPLQHNSNVCSVHRNSAESRDPVVMGNVAVSGSERAMEEQHYFLEEE